MTFQDKKNADDEYSLKGFVKIILKMTCIVMPIILISSLALFWFGADHSKNGVRNLAQNLDIFHVTDKGSGFEIFAGLALIIICFAGLYMARKERST